jgi:hypothetical protein
MGMDLFSYREVYPQAPGYCGRETSRAAARDMMPRQGTIQAKVLEALAQRPMTSFELAAYTGISYRSIQPRTSELARSTGERGALIADSGLTREDPETGKRAVVWQLAPGGSA